MNDDDELSEVRESLCAEGAGLAGVHLDRPAEAVMARGQALQLRRRLLRGLSGVAAASAAMALVLGLALGGTGIRQVHVTEASWSVNTNQDGTVTVVLREVSDPVRLQSVLHEAGVPAAVRLDESCGVTSRPKFTSLRRLAVSLHGSVVKSGWSRWTIRPALIPAYTKIVVNVPSFVVPKLPSRHLHPVIWAIIPASTRLTCAGSPLTRISPHPACSTSPHATPSPAGTPSPSRTARPHATPSPDPTARPHATPSPDPTARPQGTPSPASTPSPAGTPSPEGTPSPDRTPSAHATPSASPSPSGTCTPSPHPASTKNSGAG